METKILLGDHSEHVEVRRDTGVATLTFRGSHVGYRFRNGHGIFEVETENFIHNVTEPILPIDLIDEGASLVMVKPGSVTPNNFEMYSKEFTNVPSSRTELVKYLSNQSSLATGLKHQQYRDIKAPRNILVELTGIKVSHETTGIYAQEPVPDVIITAEVKAFGREGLTNYYELFDLIGVPNETVTSRTVTIEKVEMSIIQLEKLLNEGISIFVSEELMTAEVELNGSSATFVFVSPVMSLTGASFEGAMGNTGNTEKIILEGLFKGLNLLTELVSTGRVLYVPNRDKLLSPEQAISNPDSFFTMLRNNYYEYLEMLELSEE